MEDYTTNASTSNGTSDTYNNHGNSRTNGTHETYGRKQRRPSHDTMYPLYVIYSNWCFDDIYSLLNKYCHDASEVGNLKIDYDIYGNDTNKTFVLLANHVAEGLRKDGYFRFSSEGNRTGLSVSKYRIKDDFVLVNKSLCVPIPTELGAKGSEIKTIITSKMEECVRFGILKTDDCIVRVNLADRESDKPGSTAFISFNISVSDETIAIVKALLHNTYWPAAESQEGQESQFIFNCHYARSGRPRHPSVAQHQDQNTNGQNKTERQQKDQNRDPKDQKKKTFYKYEAKG